jgi:AraC-like DNA-binding protein
VLLDFFEHYFENGGIHLKYARSALSVRDQEIHDYYEFVFFLGGSARFSSKSIQRNLSLGDVIFIPRNAFHLFSVQGNDYTRCILGFYETPALAGLLGAIGGEVCLIESPAEMLSALIGGVLDAAERQMPKEEMTLYLQASIVHLLFEFKRRAGDNSGKNIGVSRLVRDVLSLVDERYSKYLTVDIIASELHISKSLLSHTFKEEMGISVYQYISKKRLSVAGEMIAAGIPVTRAATQSGFADYSCFLRMYKAQYGCAPTERNETKKTLRHVFFEKSLEK